MRAGLLALAMACAAHAASIRGVVLEDQTGHPLVRASVVLEPVAGTPGSPRGERTGLNGEFLLKGISAGTYLITAVRRGFAPVQYGQKRSGAAGLPMRIEEKDDDAIEIRMSRYGAVSGKVIDENNVGLPGHQVAVYRDVRPLQLTAQGITDDRGIFRIFGLEPGPYLVRSLTRVYEDATYVPTYFKDALNAGQANTVQVELGADSALTEIHATPGALYSISGTVSGAATAPIPNIQVMLVADTGTQSVSTDESGKFEFPQLAPGRYELAASGRSPRAPAPLAAFRAVTIDRNLTDQRLILEPLPQLSVALDGVPGDLGKAQILMRRSTLAGPLKAELLKLNAQPITVHPGYWEFALAPSPAIYAAVFTTPDGERISAHAEGWNRVLIAPAAAPTVKFALAGNPATIRGTVKGASGNGVSGVPVFLEPAGLDPARRLTDFTWARADAQGRFAFPGLAPGNYRLMGTFEFLNPCSTDFDRAHATLVAVEAGQSATQDVELFLIREK